jgi:hypothetical protein
MATQSLPLTVSRPARLLGPALLTGGLLWVGQFWAIIANGAQTGSLPTSADADLPLYMRVALRLFILSVPLLLAGLAALAARVRARSPKLTIAAALFMSIAGVLSTLNVVTISGLAGAPYFNDTFLGLSVFATSIATGLLGAAALRTGALRRSEALALVGIGVTTIPILFGTPLPFGPDWATDFLAFLTSGVAFAIVGARTLR